MIIQQVIFIQNDFQMIGHNIGRIDYPNPVSVILFDFIN